MAWPVAAVIAAALVLLAVAAFEPVVHNEFIRYDDQQYLTENLAVQRGLSWAGLGWALTTMEAHNWHPLTWLSHMLDCQLFGLANPGGHHATSLALHAASAVALWLAMWRLTGAVAPSVLVAVLFAVHPLATESVAWAAERKNVLSTLFWFLTLAAYAQYARHGGGRWYALVAGLLTLGLAAKQMLVTLPCVLLLLDYWPLGRLAHAADSSPARGRLAGATAPASWPWLVVEKLPLLGLAAGASALVLAAQGSTQIGLADLPLSLRLHNALVTYATYLYRLVWPAGLAVYYPHRGGAISVGETLAAGGLLATISAVAIWQARRRPYLIVGWLWYLGTLVPVLGLIQVGSQALADRYTYVPLVGIYIMIAFVLEEWIAGLAWRCRAAVAVAAMVVAALVVASRAQAARWKNTQTLFQHALEVTRDNHVAYHLVGEEFLRNQKYIEAEAHLKRAVELAPGQPRPHLSLAELYRQTRRPNEALAQYNATLAASPDYDGAYSGRGQLMLDYGKLQEAEADVRRAIALNPTAGRALLNLAIICSMTGRSAEAIAVAEQAVATFPGTADPFNTLGSVLVAAGKARQAKAAFQQALAIDPRLDDAARRLVWMMATHPDPALREPAAAVNRAEALVAQSGSANPFDFDVLAAAYAAVGRFQEAVAAIERGIRLAEAQGQTAVAQSMASRRAQYAAGQPFVDQAP